MKRLLLRSTHGDAVAAESFESSSNSIDGRGDVAAAATHGLDYTWELKRIRTLGKGSYGVATLVEVTSEPPAWFPDALRQGADGKVADTIRLVVKEVNLSACPSGTRASIFREIRILKSVDHPNVVRYVDSTLDIDTNTLYILMEHCDGGDVAAFIDAANRRPVRGATEDEVWALLIQTLMALRCLHLEHRVIHRDLKPQNIFLTSRGVVKVGDFGVSAVLSQNADFAKTFVGSPHYLAPEVVDQQPYNGKADMWSLGCVLYEVMSGGRRVFDGSSLVAVLSDIVSGSFPAIDEVVNCLGPGERLQDTATRTAFGPELRKIVGKLLQAEPEKRASVTMLLRVPFITARSGTLLPPELQTTAPYVAQLRTRTSRPRRRGHETPLAFGGGDTWSEAASAAASPIMRPLRRIRSDASMAHSPPPGSLPRGHSGAELPRANNANANNPNLRLKMALDAKRNHASQDGSPQSEGLPHLQRHDSRNGTVLFPRDSPMIPIFGSEFASGNASPAAGSFRQPKRGAQNARFERSDDSEHPLLRDIADLVPMEDGGEAAAAAVAAAVEEAEKALRVSEEMGITDSDDEEYSDDFDSAMDSSVGDDIEQRVYTTWACPRIDVGFQLRERLSTARKAQETSHARAAAQAGSGSENTAFSNTAPPQVVSDLEMLLDSKSPDATRR